MAQGAEQGKQGQASKEQPADPAEEPTLARLADEQGLAGGAATLGAVQEAGGPASPRPTGATASVTGEPRAALTVGAMAVTDLH